MDKYFKIEKFIKKTPTFNKIFRNEQIRPCIYGIDHIGIRTFKPDNFHLICQKYNYTKVSSVYNYPKFNSSATYYNNPFYFNHLHSNFDIPKIFISSYNSIIYDKNFTNMVDIELARYYILHKSNIHKMMFQTYNNVLSKNQYLAWLLCFRENISHIALKVTDIYKVTELCQKYNIKLNNINGNEIKTSKDETLLQASTKADLVPFKFKNGFEKIPYGYIELVERKYENKSVFDENNTSNLFDATK